MKRQELLNAINKVDPALKDGKLIEFKGLLLFDGEKLVSYGDEISVSVPLKTNFIGAIKAEEFKKLVQKISEAEIDIQLDKDQIVVSAGKTKAGFSLIEYNPESIPDLGLAQVGRWFTFPDNFIDDLKFSIFSASTDDAFGVLCNVKIEKDRILSSDNYRITEKTLSDEMKGLARIKEGLLIPRKIASFISSFDISQYAITESCIHYKDNTGVVFTHKMISDEYPDLDAYLEIEGQKLDLPKNLAGALSRAQAVISKDDDKVTISVEKKIIRIKGKGVGTWFEEPVDTDYKGEKLQFNASPEHLIQILNYSNITVVGDNALLFTGDKFRHSVCLIADDNQE